MAEPLHRRGDRHRGGVAAIAAASPGKDRNLKTLIHGYLSAPAEAVAFTDRPLGNGRVALDFDFALRRGEVPAGRVTTDYLVAGTRCFRVQGFGG